MAGFTGSCLCKAVTYKSNADPLMILNCHCENCRRLTGSVFGTNLFVPEDQLQFDGELTTFNHEADSGNTMTRQFCTKCGTQLFGSSSGRHNVVSVRAGIKRFRHRVSWIACRLWPLLGWGSFGTVLAQLAQ